MNQRVGSVSGMNMPGYNPPDGFAGDDSASETRTSYKIPPAFWMVFFLVVGYLMLRKVVE